MIVIGFFQDLFSSLGGLLDFITKPLGELNSDIAIEPFASLSIISLLGSSLVVTLVALLVVHLVRLFIGG